MSAPILVISYHYLRSKNGISHPGIHPVEPEQFIQQIRRLQSKYSIIRPDEFQSWLEGGKLSSPSVLITFDDGLRDHLIAATMLEHLGLRGAFFVCSRPALEAIALPVHKIHWLRAHTAPDEFFYQFASRLPSEWQQILTKPTDLIRSAASETYQFDSTEHQVLKYLINFMLPYECVDEVTRGMLHERQINEELFCQQTYLTADEMREMANRGHLIGCHSHLHQPLSRFSSEELHSDITTNQAFLRNLGLTTSWLAYPYGSEWSLPEDTRTFTKSVGIDAAFSYERGWNVPSTPHDRLRRIDCNEIDDYLNRPSAT